MLREYRGDGYDNCGIPAGMDFIKAGMVGELTGCENLRSMRYLERPFLCFSQFEINS